MFNIVRYNKPTAIPEGELTILKNMMREAQAVNIKYLPVKNVQTRDIEPWIGLGDNDEDSLIVVKERGLPVAFALITIDSTIDNGVIIILQSFTAKEHRRQGYGRAIVAYIEVTAMELGMSVEALWDHNNKPAAAFWKAVGVKEWKAR